ncbi:hypothetical protein WA026_022433 [Henosepilachna vigintioctopunctata]|uniref:Uncharacterized protein n=1 Tax=Henosepilachna vigintioctopunctata TaxID=420089 RepID=A0AAW1UFC6_9CUCU
MNSEVSRNSKDEKEPLNNEEVANDVEAAIEAEMMGAEETHVRFEVSVEECTSPEEDVTLEQCELNKMSSSSNISTRHLSKSTSELSSPREMPEARPSSAASPGNTHMSVYQKAHSFISQLKHRWGHGKKRTERPYEIAWKT